MNRFAFILFFLTALPFKTFALEETLEVIEVSEVRGNKDNKTFLESNESISVLKTKNLNRGDLQNSVQMLNGFANVQTQSDRAGDTFSIRGISDMGVTGFQKDNLASILVDDIFQTPLSVRAGSFENWDLESVEIHRGAQSTTQGVNSLAGNILLYHTRPSFENSGSAKLTLGNFGRKEGAVVQDVKVTEKLGVRLSYNKETSDGFIKNTGTGNDKWGDRNKDHFVTDFLYKLNGNQDLRLNLKLLRMHKGGSYVQNRDYEVDENNDYNEITNNQQIGLTHTKKFSDRLSNKIIIGATQATSTTTSDEDGSSGPRDAGVRNGNDKDSFLSFENQLKYQSDRIKNVAGFHVHKYRLNNHYDMNLMVSSVLMIPTIQENNKDRETYAFFDSFSYDLTKHHTVTLGGRFEVVKNTFGADIQVPPGFPPYSNLVGNHEDTNTNTVVLPKIGYNYRNNDYSIGANYSQGFRTGGVSVNRFRATTNQYDPEKTHNYELSYKYQQKKILLAANAFYTKWKDQQVEVILSNNFDTQVENATGSELYGAEVESSYLFDNYDSIRLNAGYVHTQFLTFKNGTRDYTGNAFPDAAKWTGQLSYWKNLTSRWRIIFIERYVGSSFTDADNDREAPKQFYSDINAQYDFSQYMLELYVRNIFDQQYRLLDGSPRTATTPYQGTYNRMSAPQEFGARLNYYW